MLRTSHRAWPFHRCSRARSHVNFFFCTFFLFFSTLGTLIPATRPPSSNFSDRAFSCFVLSLFPSEHTIILHHFRPSIAPPKAPRQTSEPPGFVPRPLPSPPVPTSVVPPSPAEPHSKDSTRPSLQHLRVAFFFYFVPFVQTDPALFRFAAFFLPYCWVPLAPLARSRPRPFFFETALFAQRLCSPVFLPWTRAPTRSLGRCFFHSRKAAFIDRPQARPNLPSATPEMIVTFSVSLRPHVAGAFPFSKPSRVCRFLVARFHSCSSAALRFIF